MLALLLLIQLSSPRLYSRIMMRPEVLAELQQEEKSEEIQTLYNDFLATREPLRQALNLVRLPEGIDLRPYIYLSRVVRVVPEPEPRRKEIDLPVILEKHKRWLETDGKEGERADLSGAYLSRTNLSGANLRGADLSGADLSWANFEKADLSGADLWRAALIGADLSEANLMGTDLRGADIEDAKISASQLQQAKTDRSIGR